MSDIKTLTIFESYKEIKRIDRKIDLIKTLRETTGKLSASKLKEDTVQLSFISNDAILNAVSKKDGYKEVLQQLYKAKSGYEKFIADEIEDRKITEPQIVIGYLRDYKREKWDKIARTMKYDKRQCHRLYDEYKGRTPQDNSSF